MHSLAIFGGTFDPIHNGHVQTSLTIQAYFKFDGTLFLPCKIPTLKPQAQALSEHRIEMIQLAIKDQPHFKLDEREIQRTTPSYMVETLQCFRKDYPDTSITLIIGYDSFLTLSHWHQWEQLITLAHILVINRMEFMHHPLSKLMHEFLEKHHTQDKTTLLNTPSGCLFLFDAGHYDISSTALRADIKKGADVNNKLPYSVYEYIKSHRLYLDR